MIIREVIAECYGWPVEKEHDLYPGTKRVSTKNARDPRNKSLKLPKGPNSRTNLKESFQRISSKELVAWREGNYGELSEDVNYNPCDKCDKMFPSASLNKDADGKYVCGSCYDRDTK